MDQVRLTAQDAPEALRGAVARLREQLGVPASFPEEALAEAQRAAASVSLPELDRTDIDLLTIDPPGAMDLDQAVHIEGRGAGYRVYYAIADVGAFIAPGGAIDREAQARGETFYAPSLRTPLHPPALSEGAASLLPGERRPALLWELDLDADGALRTADVRRALVRSRQRLDYAGVQAALDAGTASASLQLLREVGELRQAAERARGGVSLRAPEQEVVPTASGWGLAYRQPLPVEDWNAQISLLTGMAAAGLMLRAGIGILRTLPPAAPQDVDRLRRIAAGLGLAWSRPTPYADFVRGLDPAVPTQAAMLTACTRLFRGAGYAAFDGPPPAEPVHAALAAEYAHCTAPLRRLVDRFSGEVCLAVCAGAAVPEWTRVALPTLPALMGAADARAKKYERGIVDLVEALVLKDRVGETFTGVVIAVDGRGGGTVQLADPAVEARATGELELGAQVAVRLEAAVLELGGVRFRAG